MKEKLLALIAKKEQRKAELGNSVATTESVAELRAMQTEIEGLNDEIAQLRAAVAEMDGAQNGGNNGELGAEGRSGSPNIASGAGFNPVAAFGAGSGAEGRGQDQSELEARKAFMNYVQTGEKSDALEYRNDAKTMTTDIGAVIPTTILNRIVQKVRDYGRIYRRITTTAIKGGVEVPVSTAKPTATWVAAGAMANKQKQQVSGKVSFSYHKLQVRVAVDLVAELTSLPIFEDTLVENTYEAIIVAIESAILNGTGTGQPKGITTETVPAKRSVSVSSEEFGQYGTWTALLGKVPRSYRNGAVIIMNDEDWNAKIVGMVDEQGQPIARVNYGINGETIERLLGKEVIPVEEELPSIAEADVGDVVGVIVKLEDYLFNSNMQLTVRKYFNEETDEYVTKATLVGDGKLIDNNGLVLIKKKASEVAGS